MPINDPIQNRKVAPGSLAFERRRMVYGSAYAGEDPGDVYNYQYYVDLKYNVTINNIVSKTFLNTETNKIMTSMQNSEHRAKHYTSDYKQSFQWDLNDDWLFTEGVWTPIPFGNEILRTQGIDNKSFEYFDTWSFRPTDKNKGVWWVHTFLMIRFPNTSDIEEIRLAYFINDFIFREIDMIDHHMMGENKIKDARLTGGCHVPLQAGDKLEVRMHIINPTPQQGGVLFPTSVYSYITGHRENCEVNETENTPITGSDYSFSKGSNL